MSWLCQNGCRGICNHDIVQVEKKNVTATTFHTESTKKVFMHKTVKKSTKKDTI